MGSGRSSTTRPSTSRHGPSGTGTAAASSRRAATYSTGVAGTPPSRIFLSGSQISMTATNT